MRDYDVIMGLRLYILHQKMATLKLYDYYLMLVQM